MGIYGKAALKAAALLRENKNANPETIWEKAVAEFTDSVNSIYKGCPKNTFLGLLYAKKIQGLENVLQTPFESKEQEYALKACELLKEHPEHAAESRGKFWDRISHTAHQQQLDVVFAFYNAGLLNLQ